MTDDDDFRINSLHRFRKHSRLMLEAHSHCEVPAGCGGAVLQWFDPATGVPLNLRVMSSHTEREPWLNGKLARGPRPRLPPGRHVLALHLQRARGPTRIIAPNNFVCVYLDVVTGPQQARPIAEARTGSAVPWSYSLKTPPASWHEPTFDDSAWPTLQKVTFEPTAFGDQWLRDRFVQFVTNQAGPLALPDATNVWVRLVFNLTAEEAS